MELSKDTHEVLNFLDKFTNGNIRKRDDLGVILELGASYNAFSLVNNIISSGKSIWNISKKLDSICQTADGYHLLKKELERNILNLKKLLKQLIELNDNTISERFVHIYYSKSENAFSNIMDLSHDLAELKNLQNSLRRLNKK